MSGAAALAAPGGPLRVFVSAQDAARRAALISIIGQAGHELAASIRDADVVLSDSAGAPGGGYLVVNTGADDQEPAGLLAVDADPQQIDAALRAVAAGLIVRAPSTSESGFRAIEDVEEQGLLTPRENEVLHAIAEGLTNKAVARRLGISLHTVKFHLELIFRKLGVRTRTGAITKAAEWRRNLAIEL